MKKIMMLYASLLGWVLIIRLGLLHQASRKRRIFSNPKIRRAAYA